MNQSHNEGDRASFTCQADGEPLPTISWYFNDASLYQINNSKYMFISRRLLTSVVDILIIINVQSSDMGTYTCNATNIVSFDATSRILTVNGELLV